MNKRLAPDVLSDILQRNGVSPMHCESFSRSITYFILQHSQSALTRALVHPSASTSECTDAIGQAAGWDDLTTVAFGELVASVVDMVTSVRPQASPVVVSVESGDASPTTSVVSDSGCDSGSGSESGSGSDAKSSSSEEEPSAAKRRRIVSSDSDSVSGSSID